MSAYILELQNMRRIAAEYVTIVLKMIIFFFFYNYFGLKDGKLMIMHDIYKT